MGRILDIIRASLEQEREGPKKPDRNRDEREFLPAAIELVETPASPVGRAIMAAISGFFVLALLWASFGEIDIHATAQGKIIPTGKVKPIEPLEPGTVRAIHVKNGDKVQAGHLLIELDPTEATADRERLSHDLMVARLEAARLLALQLVIADGSGLEVALAAFRPPDDMVDALLERQKQLLRTSLAAHLAQLASVDGEIVQREAERARIEGSVAERTRMVAVIRELADTRKGLAKRKVVTRAEYLQTAQQLHEEAAILASERGSLDEVEAAIEALELRRREIVAAFEAQTLIELAEAEKRVGGLRQELIKAVRRQERNQLMAPVAGTVRQLAVHAVGSVVTTGEQLLIIVPEESGLEIEALVLNKDKGFVETGDPAEIKLETFPFTKYGTIPGTLLDVSNDAIEDAQLGLAFPVRVAMQHNQMRVDGRMVALTPGMNATVEIKTGKRRIIEYLLSPLFRYRDEAIRER